jgi:integrase
MKESADESNCKQRSPEPKVRRDGSIKTLIDGKKYKLRIYCGTTSSGKRHYFSQVFRGTAGQASVRLQELALNIDKGIIPSRIVPEPEPVVAPVLLSEVLEKWLTQKIKNRKTRPRTLRNYEWLLTTYVNPVLGSKPISEITELDIQDLYNRLSERGLSGKTIANPHKVLEPALTRAVAWEYISKNPSLHVELPAWHRKEAKYLTEEQARAFLTVAHDNKWYAAFSIAIEIFPRPNELLGLHWDDIDFDNHALSIRRSLYWPKGGGYEFTRPKTQRSNRMVTISPAAIEVLRQHRRIQLEQRMEQGSDYQDQGLVFATASGSPVLWRNLTRRTLKPLLKAAGIPPEGFSMYSLRHTGISIRVANNENIRVIAEIAGTSVAMIDKTYSHVPRKLQQSATDRIAKILYGT